jgi:hypothetical protein
MEIKYKKLAGYDRKVKSDLGYESVTYLYFYGKDGNLKEIRDWGRKTFKVYQDDDNIKYGEHEIFKWGDNNYFTYTLNAEKHGENRNNEIVSMIKNKLETTFNNLDITIVFGIDYVLSSSKIRKFLDEYAFNPVNIPFDKFNVLEWNTTSFPEVSNICKLKYKEIQKEIFTYYKDKKVVIVKSGSSSMIPDEVLNGRFRNYDNEIVFFKLRARNHFYRLQLNNIYSLKLA